MMEWRQGFRFCACAGSAKTASPQAAIITPPTSRAKIVVLIRSPPAPMARPDHLSTFLSKFTGTGSCGDLPRRKFVWQTTSRRRKIVALSGASQYQWGAITRSLTMNVPKISEAAAQNDVTSELRSPQVLVNNGMAPVHLSMAVCDYDHIRDLANGQVRADGIVLTPLVFESIEEITFRFLKNLEWDISELSFGKYISLTAQGGAPMVAIPVFPSRVHRHSAIYVRADRGIKTAADLNK